MGTKISGLPGMSTLTGAEIIPGVQSSATKRTTLTTMAAYVVDTLMVSDTVTPATGDKIIAERGGEEKRHDIDALASYIVATGWSVATEVTPATNADKFLANRSGTIVELDIDTIVTYATNTLISDGLGSYINGLSAATLADSDQYLVTQGSTCVKTTWTAVAARAHSQFSTYAEALSAVTVGADADVLYIVQGGTAKKIALNILASYIVTASSANITGKLWDADIIDPMAGTDVFVCERSNVSKTVTGATIGAYVNSLLSEAASADPIVDTDSVPVFRSGVAKTIAANLLADYMSGEIVADATGLTALTTFADTDYIMVARAGVLRAMDKDDMITEVLDGVQATVLDIDWLPAATLADAQYAYVLDGETPKQATWLAVANYVMTKLAAYVGGRDSGAPVVDGDHFLINRSDVAYRVLGSDIATYIMADHWDQTAGTTVAAGDQFIMSRTGTGYRKVTGAMINTYIAGAAAATGGILDFSLLSTGTIAGADMFAVTQTTTPKKVTWTALLAAAWTSHLATIQAVSEKTDLVVGDEVLLLDSEDSSALKRGSITNLLELQEAKWKILDSSTYTSLPASTTTISMSNTSQVNVGDPLRYLYGGTYYYGIVTSIITNVSISIRGATLDAGVGIDELCVGIPGLVTKKTIRFDGAYMVPWVLPNGGTTKATMLADIARAYFRWHGPPACLVEVAGVHKTADTTAQPYVNVRVYQDAAWHDILTENTNKGIRLDTGGTWVSSSAVGVSVTRYDIADREDFEVNMDATGCDGDATDLQLDLTFVSK